MTSEDLHDDPPDDDDESPTLDLQGGELGAGLYPRVVLRPKKARPFFGRHPWVLDKAIESVEGSVADGDVVDLVSDKGKRIGRGVYNSKSRIRVRLYAWGSSVGPLDDAFWRTKLEAAVALRTTLGYDRPEGAARVVFSESDGLSGLIVDRYAEYLAVQVTSLAMAVRLPTLVPMLVDLLHPKGVFLRTEKGVTVAEGMEHKDGLFWGQAPSGPVFIEEHGLRYGVDLAEGQKTGFYLDQRQNRLAAAKYVRDRRVLDMFSYSGAFSLTASRLGGAREVIGVDTSEKAVALAKGNARLNEVTNVRFESADAFAALDQLVARHERFGVVFLDPPKFARSRQAVGEALQAYHRINRLAVDLLEPGGILVTSSCSGHVTREDFLEMLAGVSQRTGRDIQVLEQRGASPDHPVTATCLENEYLKCFICRAV
jgi:23S rRNA (cytosine1962-C5)-methyltransferase